LRLFPDQATLERWRNWRSGLQYDIPGRDAVLSGALDDLLVGPTGELSVLDYKTRGYPPKEEVPSYYEDQMNLYSLLLAGNGHPVSDTAYLVYYYPNGFEGEGEILFASEVQRIAVDENEASSLVGDALDVLQEEIPGTSESCEYCEWAGKIQEALSRHQSRD
jgi:RecB family exonuclease